MRQAACSRASVSKALPAPIPSPNPQTHTTTITTATLQLVEFNPLDADEIGGVLRKGMRVVLVVGDQVGCGGLGAQAAGLLVGQGRSGCCGVWRSAGPGGLGPGQQQTLPTSAGVARLPLPGAALVPGCCKPPRPRRLRLQAGSRRPDLRVYDAVVDALLESASKIGQLVVVTPQGGGGNQLFGRGGGSGARLSPLEAKVADSGADYLIVRAAPSDRVTDRYGEQANLVVAPAGRLPSGLQASRAQVGRGSTAGAACRPRGQAGRWQQGLCPASWQRGRWHVRAGGAACTTGSAAPGCLCPASHAAGC